MKSLLDNLIAKKIQPHNFILANLDTDSISFIKPDQKPFSKEECETLLDEINSLMPERIRWEDDRTYKRFIVVKAKNYVLYDGNNITIKGSGLKASMKEPALKQFIKDLIDLLLNSKKEHIFNLYNDYAKRILNITDISNWCSTKTITKSILNPERTTERRILAAIKNLNLNEGDRVQVFFKTKEELCLKENFNGEYDRTILLGKLYDTLKIFSSIIDISLFPDYSLKKNKPLLGI